MDTITTKVTKVIMDIINNKYIITDTIIYIRRLFLSNSSRSPWSPYYHYHQGQHGHQGHHGHQGQHTIKVTTTTKVNIYQSTITTTKVNMVIKVTKVQQHQQHQQYQQYQQYQQQSSPWTGGIGAGGAGQQQERLALVEQQDMRDTWVINDCQKKT